MFNMNGKSSAAAGECSDCGGELLIGYCGDCMISEFRARELGKKVSAAYRREVSPVKRKRARELHLVSLAASGRGRS